MATAAPIVTLTARQRMTISGTLTLAQWLSPSYPLGSFAYSHGLETAIAEGWVTDAQTLRYWLSDILASGSGRSDAILLHAAHNAHDFTTIDATGRAFVASAERLRESLHQGAAFTRTTAAIWGDDMPELLFPVALGFAAARHEISATLTASMYLHAFASNIIMVCVRLVPLGQTEGQKVLNALAPLCENIAQDTANATIDDLCSSTFMSDIAAMRHETLQPRLFQS